MTNAEIIYKQALEEVVEDHTKAYEIAQIALRMGAVLPSYKRDTIVAGLQRALARMREAVSCNGVEWTRSTDHKINEAQAEVAAVLAAI